LNGSISRPFQLVLREKHHDVASVAHAGFGVHSRYVAATGAIHEQRSRQPANQPKTGQCFTSALETNTAGIRARAREHRGSSGDCKPANPTGGACRATQTGWKNRRERRPHHCSQRDRSVAVPAAVAQREHDERPPKSSTRWQTNSAEKKSKMFQLKNARATATSNHAREQVHPRVSVRRRAWYSLAKPGGFGKTPRQ